MVAARRRGWWSQFASVPVLVVVFGLFALWYHNYEGEERAYLRARNLRLVDAVATHIERTLTATNRAIGRMAQAAGDGSLLAVDPREAPLVTRLRALFRGPSFKSIDVNFARAAGATAAPADRMRLVPDRAPRFVEFDHQVPCSACADVQVITVKADLAELLRSEPASDADGQPVFSDVVLATPDGEVVSQRDATGGRWVRLPPELLRNDAGGFERVVTTRTSDESLLVFRQLVQLPDLQRAGQPLPALILCAIVPAARFQSLTRSFSSAIQLLLLLAVALAALAWPFLRVAFSGAHEPLRPWNLAVAGLFGIALVAVLTLAAVDGVLYRLDLRRATDTQLVQLAAEVRLRLLAELERTRAALDGLPEGALAVDGRSHGQMFSDPRFDGLQRAYPFTDDIALIGPGDNQVTKWSRDRYSTPLYDVGGRGYVRDLRAGLWWTVGEGALAADNVRRYSNGTKETVVASFGPAARAPEANLQTLPIRTMSAEMVSVSAPILPRGYTIALFREDGAVVYHSNPEKAIDENIYQELGDARPFQAMAVITPFDAQYEGRDYRAMLAVVPGTPLRLAVLHDQLVSRTLNLRFVARTTAAGAVLFALECLLLLAIWHRSPRHLAWCWPNPSRFGRLLIALACVTGLAAIVGVARLLAPAQALLVGMAAMALGMLACWYILDRLPRSALEHWLRRAASLPLVGRVGRWLGGRVDAGARLETTKLTYVALLTGLLVLLAVLPTLAIADLTYRWTLEQELVLEVANVQAAWEARERAIEAQYGHANPAIAARRRADRSDFYATVRPGRAGALAVDVASECPTAAGGSPFPSPTGGLLSAADAVAMNLALRRSRTVPASAWRGRYEGAVICAAADPAAPDTAAGGGRTHAFVVGETRPGRTLGGWRPWGVAVLALFWVCWCAVGLFRRRVYGFLDACPPIAPPPTAAAADQWERCSADERDVLVLVASGQLVPRSYEDAATRLVTRGLIVCHPLPRLVSRELYLLARAAPATETLAPASWRGLPWRPLFGAGLVAAAVFIYFTQPSGSLAFVTGLAAIVPVLSRIAAFVTGGPTADQSS